ncbi:MAG: NADH-quinone oxidoreductase subunit NuoE [Peptococcaceae bacterium]|jgi:NADH-quinone oxidoreductase E subunit|nr:NADH-quinone oxidoreductase subunit NuoE [Peptococcaceae bacterium]MDH7523814.1 NADH-quinone oxidoreductase subunit NuoE [Peptococcaceae bacterium]
MSCLCQCGTGKESEILAFIDRIIDAYKGQKGALIPVLHQVQEHLGYLPEDVQAYIAEKLNVPLSEVYGVVSFYTLFSTVPKGKYKISVCLGTACYVKGSGQILAELEKELNINVGSTTEDGLFTLEACRCLGCCGLAPVLMVNDNVHGRLTKSDVGAIIKKYREIS